MPVIRSTTTRFEVPADSGEWQPPESLEWMPAGRHEIQASLDGKPWRGTVEAGPEDAARLDAQLQDRLAASAAGKASRPFVDLAHEGKEAAALPKRFYWQDGIRLAVEWTKAGLDALRGRVFAYFSPEFEVRDGRPAAIAKVGPIGGLTNQPAFQTIQRLAASHTENQSMSTLIKSLVSLGLVADGVEDEVKVAAAVTASVNRMTAELNTAKDRAASAAANEGKLQAELVEFRRQREEGLEAEIEGHVKAGIVPPESRAFFVDSIKRDEKGTRELIATLKPAATSKGIAPVRASFTAVAADKSTAERIKAQIAAEPDASKRQYLRTQNWSVLSGAAA